jgi:hypothetical protein
MKILFFVLIICSIFVINCTNNTGKSNFHPQEERIPYYNSDVEVLEIEREYDESAKEEIIFRDQPVYKNVVFKEKLGIELVDSIKIPDGELSFGLFESVSNTSILYTDSFLNNLFQFKKGDESWMQIAGRGRGPGEMLFTSDIIVSKDTVYTVHKDGRINKFICTADGCVFSEMLALDSIQPESIQFSKDAIIAMGLTNQVAHSGQSDTVNTENIKSLYAFNQDRKKVNSYGEFYDIDKHWMLIRPFSEGMIRMHPTKDLLIQSFNLFPYLYVFEGESLVKKIKFSGFNLSKREYKPESQELFVNFDNWSQIQDIGFINDTTLVVAIRHSSDRTVKSDRVDWIESKDIYFINTEDWTSYYLGNYNVNDSNIWFTSRHIIFKQNNYLKLFTFNVK